MAARGDKTRSCCKCGNDTGNSLCDGCRQLFCPKHKLDHRKELAKRMDDLSKQTNTLHQDISKVNIDKTLLDRINKWEKDSIEKIHSTANNARSDLKRLTDESRTRLDRKISQLSNELLSNRKNDAYTEVDVDRWMNQLTQLRDALQRSSPTCQIAQDDTVSIHSIIVHASDQKSADCMHSLAILSEQEKPTKIDAGDRSLQDGSVTLRKSQLSYQYDIFGLTASHDQELRNLLTELTTLQPMNKHGVMSGNCDAQTTQMEQFLTDTFGFQNIPGKCIVQGVKSFKLKRYPHHMDPNTIIQFPKSFKDAFTMTIKEIIQWQQSYRVYAYRINDRLTKDFLSRALLGQSADGEEAFLMKYVVRISTCPILMEFDAKIISRNLHEDWPNRIKLVSVTGIDFAGRKHDVDDILFYLSNWKDVYEVDRTGNKPALANERDFLRKSSGTRGILHEERLLRSLKDMARVRLRACDMEGVQIVVETGIGLGVFAGEAIGIAEQVQFTSALAIRTALEQDAPSYKSIRAVVFALPIIDRDHNRRINNPFKVFIEQFQQPNYNGRIPILIADQDMHRLTVAIAHHGFVVSELNPADSHGVFGEYWQNRGPAVEEKLALTTIGLLVQHHLINPNVLNPNNYILI